MRTDEELRAICLAATPGKRIACGYDADEFRYHDGYTAVFARGGRTRIAVFDGDGGQEHADAAHIAAFSPDRCIALLNIVEAARAVYENDDAFTEPRRSGVDENDTAAVLERDERLGAALAAYAALS